MVTKYFTLTEKQRAEVLLFATYSIWYCNDLACNCVKEIQPYIQDKCKETKKIYGALIKRVNGYFRNINKFVGNDSDFLAEFMLNMDELCEDKLEQYRQAIENAYKSVGIENPKYYSLVETARSMCEFAYFSMNSFIDRCSEISPKYDALRSYNIKEIKEIIDNFATWEYRFYNGDVVDMNKQEKVMTAFRNLSDTLLDYYSFDKSYERQFNKESPKNQKKKIMAISNDNDKIVFESITDASKHFGCSRSTIQRHIDNGKELNKVKFVKL